MCKSKNSYSFMLSLWVLAFSCFPCRTPSSSTLLSLMASNGSLLPLCYLLGLWSCLPCCKILKPHPQPQLTLSWNSHEFTNYRYYFSLLPLLLLPLLRKQCAMKSWIWQRPRWGTAARCPTTLMALSIACTPTPVNNLSSFPSNPSPTVAAQSQAVSTVECK